jgi:hypothetical protein
MPGCWPKSLPPIVVERSLRRYSTWFGTVAIAMVLVAIAVVPTSRNVPLLRLPPSRRKKRMIRTEESEAMRKAVRTGSRQ